MYAVVSLLDELHYSELEKLWRELEGECGLAGISLTPLPHFSWHIAAEYDLKQLEITLAQLAGSVRPFIVRTSGLGLFTAESPVIYIPLVKDAHLANFHQEVWQQVDPLAVGPIRHYTPEAWVPHITLAHGDVSPNKLGCAIERLAFQPMNWEVTVDNLALVYSLSGQVGKLQSKFPFGG